jgi:hypothetical protein
MLWAAPSSRPGSESLTDGGRFRAAFLCGACNSPDAIAKRNVGASDNFSFSPEEIQQFVIVRDNQGHRITLTGPGKSILTAREIYRRIVGRAVTNESKEVHQ